MGYKGYMVLESLLNPLKAEKKPWEMFFIGALYSTAAIFLSLWIFEKKASFVMVFLTVLACVPIIYNTLKFEESKDLKIDSETRLLMEHQRAIWVFSFLFLGIAVAGVIWYVILPIDVVGYLFEQQIATIAEINNDVSAGVTGFATSTDYLFRIFFNNLKVLIFSILFAFVYGAGAIFILTWNATVISAAIGHFIRSNFEKIGYFAAILVGFFKYSLHGIPEILAYFYGGIAGGIISVAIIKNHFASERGSMILLDVGELILIAIGFLIVAAIFEVYLTPVLF